MGVPVLEMTASERRSFRAPARPYPRNGHAVGDAEIEPKIDQHVVLQALLLLLQHLQLLDEELDCLLILLVRPNSAGLLLEHLGANPSQPHPAGPWGHSGDEGVEAMAASLGSGNEVVCSRDRPIDEGQGVQAVHDRSGIVQIVSIYL